MAQRILRMVAIPEPRYCPECGQPAASADEFDLGEGTQPVLTATCPDDHLWEVSLIEYQIADDPLA